MKDTSRWKPCQWQAIIYDAPKLRQLATSMRHTSFDPPSGAGSSDPSYLQQPCKRLSLNFLQLRGPRTRPPLSSWLFNALCHQANYIARSRCYSQQECSFSSDSFSLLSVDSLYPSYGHALTPSHLRTACSRRN